jgi:sugar lactone lactonase YvrE
MAERTFETLTDGGTFFEGPRWHDGRWWVSDFYRHAVFAIDPSGATEQILTVENQPSGLGFTPDGALLVVSMRDHRLLRRDPDGTVTEVADLSEHCGGLMNDMLVDDQGRAWIGDFGFDLMALGLDQAQPASLKRVDPDGTVTVVAEDLQFPNGSVLTPDGSTLIVGETLGSRYTAFTVGDDGTLVDRSIWADLSELPLAPDGCALDAEGHIWVSDGLGKRCARIAPGGELVDEVVPPDDLATYACMLGGDDGRTLLICAAPDFFEHSRKAAREAVLFTTRVDVPHAGLP